MGSNVVRLYNILFPQNLLPSDKLGQDNWVIMEAACFILTGFDFSGRIVVALLRSYTSPVLHL